MTDFEPSGMRIGNTEREEALRSLGEHMSAGRLDVDEYGDRTAKVTTAKTAGELAVLFSDLPAPKPGFLSPAVAPMPPPAPVHWERRRGWGSSGAVLPVLALVILALVFTRGFALPLLVIPAVLFFSARRHDRRTWAVEHRPRYERRHRGRDWDDRHWH